MVGQRNGIAKAGNALANFLDVALVSSLGLIAAAVLQALQRQERWQQCDGRL